MPESMMRIPNPMTVARAAGINVTVPPPGIVPDAVWDLMPQIEAKDASTAAHTWRVVLYTRALTESMGLDPELIERISLGAALHDLGKVDIPDAILKKPGRLTDEEFAVIKTHPSAGYDRLTAMGVTDRVVLNLVRWHHEKLDGSGYPDGLRGAEIPPGPRYFGVVDTFDAMTSVRPYRREIGAEAAEKAIAELRSKVGTWYCAECVDAWDRLYRSGQIDWILHYFNDEIPIPSFGGRRAGDGRGASGAA
jgi:HD-GYP domain-containing protein (c-di-GMP phosphodiesterase class II)